jgi:hypothetical protein
MFDLRALEEKAAPVIPGTDPHINSWKDGPGHLVRTGDRRGYG